MTYIRPIEFSGTVQRTQDVSTIKQNEDQKPLQDQSNFQQKVHKNTEHITQEVANKDNADGSQQKFDAKEKGKNQYSRQEQKQRREKESKEKVVLKNQGFDIRI